MLEAPPLPSLLHIYMYVVCDKGKGRPLGELKATFSTSESAAMQQNNHEL